MTPATYVFLRSELDLLFTLKLRQASRFQDLSQGSHCTASLGMHNRQGVKRQVTTPLQQDFCFIGRLANCFIQIICKILAKSIHVAPKHRKPLRSRRKVLDGVLAESPMAVHQQQIDLDHDVPSKVFPGLIEVERTVDEWRALSAALIDGSDVMIHQLIFRLAVVRGMFFEQVELLQVARQSAPQRVERRAIGRFWPPRQPGRNRDCSLWMLAACWLRACRVLFEYRLHRVIEGALGLTPLSFATAGHLI